MKIYRNGRKVYVCPKCRQEVWSLICHVINGVWVELCHECSKGVKKNG